MSPSIFPRRPFPCAARGFRPLGSRYRVADLFDPPGLWRAGFDFVLEAYTLQVLPVARRADAMRRVASFVALQGSLLVIAGGREDSDPAGEMPWPLTQSEFGFFESAGLSRDSWEDFMDAEMRPVRRFRACYQRR